MSGMSSFLPVWKSLPWIPRPVCQGESWVRRREVSKMQHEDFISMRRLQPALALMFPGLTRLKLWTANMLFSDCFDCHSILQLLCHPKTNGVLGSEAASSGSEESPSCPWRWLGGKGVPLANRLCLPATKPAGLCWSPVSLTYVILFSPEAFGYLQQKSCFSTHMRDMMHTSA